jgi:hypothetical protein
VYVLGIEVKVTVEVAEETIKVAIDTKLVGVRTVPFTPPDAEESPLAFVAFK